MLPWNETVTELTSCEPAVRRGRYGVIEMERGGLRRLVLRPFPKRVSLLDVLWWGDRYHRQAAGDRCLLFYNQPRACPNYLALTYIRSTRGATLATVTGGLRILDEIARVKRADAILCDVANLRISERVMARWGWEPHKPQRWHRHYIKRFYGQYA